MILKICKQCSMTFNVSPSVENKTIKKRGIGVQFCSKKCYAEYQKSTSSKIEIMCPVCGDIFKRKPSDIKDGGGKFCSHSCCAVYGWKESGVDAQKSCYTIILLQEIDAYRQTHSIADSATHFGIRHGTLSKQLLKSGLYDDRTIRRLKSPDALTQEQEETIVGNLLGDGSLSYLKSSQNSHFVIGQKADHREYVKALHAIYSPYSSGSIATGRNRKPSRIDGNICHDLENWEGEYCKSVTMYTMCHPVFTKYRQKWYKEPDGKKSPKVIPNDIRLTWRTAAIWMCDDGSNHCRIKYRQRYLMLHTESFTETDCEFLLERLYLDLSIIGSINYHEGKPTIRIGSDEWFRFIDGIKPYITWKCFQYKCINREVINRNTSGYVGVNFHEGKWRAYKSYRTNGKFKSVHIGNFDTPEEAAKAREKYMFGIKEVA